MGVLVQPRSLAPAGLRELPPSALPPIEDVEFILVARRGADRNSVAAFTRLIRDRMRNGLDPSKLTAPRPVPKGNHQARRLAVSRSLESPDDEPEDHLPQTGGVAIQPEKTTHELSRQSFRQMFVTVQLLPGTARPEMQRSV